MQNLEWNTISKYKDSEASHGFLLWKTQLTWRRLLEKKLKAHNLTHPQFVILTSLAYLTKDKQRVTQAELAQHTSCDINTTSQILRTLEKKELISRLHQNGNEKAKYPFLTEIGYSVFKAAIQTVEEADQLFFKNLPALELENFRIALLKLLAEE